MKCTSCKRDFTKGTFFTCPECKKERIERCLNCKNLNIKYKCECGFEGP